MTRRENVYTAAGGVVLDAAGKVLLIERGIVREGAFRWEVRLPKGHVEQGETDEQAAVREVCEETGYCHLEINGDLDRTITEFDLNGEHVRRTEHYFRMRLTNPARGQPHFDSPDAAEAKFVPRWAADLVEAHDLLTFESERLFAERALAMASAEHATGAG